LKKEQEEKEHKKKEKAEAHLYTIIKVLSFYRDLQERLNIVYRALNQGFELHNKLCLLLLI